MGTSVAVAQAICDRLGLVDAGRLQKLTYYCQAWSLGWFGRPLFAQDLKRPGFSSASFTALC